MAMSLSLCYTRRGKIMKRIGYILFSRLVIGALMIIFQLFVLIKLFYRIPMIFHGILFVINILLIFYIISKDEPAEYKLPWILFLLVMPTMGALFYIYCGRSKVLKRYTRRHERGEASTAPWCRQQEEILDGIEDRRIRSQSKYIGRFAHKPLYRDTEVTYFPNGEEWFPVLLKELKRAEHYIFLEYFFIREGKMWNPILEVLREKAAAGVEVRVLYDELGTFSKIPGNYQKTLNSYGIHTVVFNPFRPVLSVMHNFRDHRKITVIDGKVGFNGGMNLSDDYINEIHPHGYLKDAMLMLKGPGVQSLTMLFLETWQMYGENPGEISDYESGRYGWDSICMQQAAGYVQPFGDSPLDDELVGKTVYENILNQAKEYVYVTTPYLVADYELLNALRMAAKRGVDVRIAIPGDTDAWYIAIITKSYYKKLLRAGVKIYEYTPGFLHQKTFLSDGEVGVVGTINLDYRSLVHHFECGTWMYQCPALKDMEKDFRNIFAQSRLLTDADWKNRRIYERILQGIFHWFAPLL